MCGVWYLGNDHRQPTLLTLKLQHLPARLLGVYCAIAVE